MTVKINGFDIVNYIAYGGFKWQRTDVDGEGAGRMLDGTLERNRIEGAENFGCIPPCVMV